MIQSFRSRRRIAFAVCIITILGILWLVKHIHTILSSGGSPFALIFTITFIGLAWQTCLSYLERPITATPRQESRLNDLHVVALVPVYNEDQEALRLCLYSLLHQTRKVNTIFVVDDGSKVGYGEIPTWFLTQCQALGINGLWQRQDNAGKRHAQARGVLQTPYADVYLTVDSDAILAPNAVREAILPFKDEKVQSVAGVVVAANVNKNLFTRFTDLYFVTVQLVERSSMSTLGSVMVNSGPLAMYRADVIRDNLDSYLNETFFGKEVGFSDDSLLTTYALLRGKTVQQPTAFVFSFMPENADHHFRQQVRWMRGSFIRSWWRFRYLPMTRYAYWNHLFRWVTLVMSTLAFPVLFIAVPVAAPSVIPWLIAVPILLGYCQSLRYLTFSRSDVSFRSQMLTFSLSPLATLWSFLVLRPLRWYSIATCTRTGWGTRENVEVSAA